MISPQAQLNDAAIRAESQDRRRIAGAIASALCLSAVVVLMAAMGLHLAVALPDLMAQAVAQRGM